MTHKYKQMYLFYNHRRITFTVRHLLQLDSLFSGCQLIVRITTRKTVIDDRMMGPVLQPLGSRTCRRSRQNSQVQYDSRLLRSAPHICPLKSLVPPNSLLIWYIKRCQVVCPFLSNSHGTGEYTD
jgi:hypothetical protein